MAIGKIATTISKPSLLWLILTIIVIPGCDSSRLYEENTDIDNRVWLADDVKTFVFDIPTIDRRYNFYFNVRNTMKYPHYNLYISYHLMDSLDNAIDEGLVNFNLFDPKTGAPLGKSGLGDIFDHQFPLLEGVEFEHPGEMKFELQQFMRYDSLPEIVSAGIRIEYVLEGNQN